MAQRKRIKTIPTPQLQGDGSFVKIKEITVAEAKRFQAMEGDESEGKALFAEFVLEWDWVDDDGSPLPQPHNNPDVFDLLTPAELKFLSRTIGGDPDEKKV